MRWCGCSGATMSDAPPTLHEIRAAWDTSEDFAIGLALLAATRHAHAGDLAQASEAVGLALSLTGLDGAFRARIEPRHPPSLLPLARRLHPRAIVRIEAGGRAEAPIWSAEAVVPGGLLRRDRRLKVAAGASMEAAVERLRVMLDTNPTPKAKP